MVRYMFKRLLIMIPMMFGITVVSYIIMNLAPGDAATMFIDPERMHTDPEAIERVREQLGLNYPIYIRYIRWLGQLLRGNFGFSYISRQPVLREIQLRVVPTIILMLSSLTISITVGVGVGVFCARRQYKLPDYLLSVFAMMGMSVPNFWFAMMLILLFTLTLGWLPSVGLGTVGLTGSWYVLTWDRISHMIMPVMALSLAQMGTWMRFQRASYLDVMNQDYIRTARSKGLGEQTVAWRHAFRNASLPIVTHLGEVLPLLVSGSFVIENVFGLPGLGRLGIHAITGRDYPVAMGVLIFTSLLVMVGILISDLLYVFIDPRIKYETPSN